MDGVLKKKGISLSMQYLNDIEKNATQPRNGRGRVRIITSHIL